MNMEDMERAFALYNFSPGIKAGDEVSAWPIGKAMRLCRVKQAEWQDSEGKVMVLVEIDGEDVWIPAHRCELTTSEKKRKLLEDLGGSKDSATRYYGSEPFAYRSSEDMDQHNRRVRMWQEKGVLTEDEANALVAH